MLVSEKKSISHDESILANFAIYRKIKGLLTLSMDVDVPKKKSISCNESTFAK